MSKLYTIIGSLLILVIVNAQYPGWENYTSGTLITDVVQKDGCYYFATVSGLSIMDTLTGDMTYQDHANNNLPGLYISQIAKDQYDTLWIGTISGVAKQTGNIWIPVDSTNSQLDRKAVIALEIDDENTKWIVNYDIDNRNSYTLIKYSQSIKKLFDSTNSPISGNIYDMTIDTSGNIWMGLKNRILMYDDSNWTVFDSTDMPFLSEIYCRYLEIDGNNTKWIGTGKGLIKYDTIWTLYADTNSGLRYNNITCIDSDDSMNIWVGHKYGLDRYDGNNWFAYDTSSSNIPSNEVGRINTQYYGKRFMSFEDLLTESVLWDTTGWHMLNTSEIGLSPLVMLMDITHDNTGMIRAADFNGLFSYDGNSWQHMYFGDRIHMYSVCADQDNRLWMGSWSNGLYMIEDSICTIYNDTNSVLPNNSVYDVICDKNNDIWAASYCGLVRISDSIWTVFDETQLGIPSDIFKCVLVEPLSRTSIYGGSTLQANDAEDGGYIYIWVGTYNNGAVLGNGNIWVNFNTSNSNIASDQINCVAVDSNYVFWFGTDKGVCSFYDSTWVVYDTSNSDLSNNYIQNIVVDRDNRKWIGTGNNISGTGGGVCVFDDSSWQVLNIDNSGIGSNVVFAMDIDQSGNVWIGSCTFAGISRYSYMTGVEDINEHYFTITSQKDYGIVFMQHNNPLNIEYSVDSDSEINISLYSITGQFIEQIYNGRQSKGQYSITWDYSGDDLVRGVYFISIEQDKNSEKRKLILF